MVKTKEKIRIKAKNKTNKTSMKINKQVKASEEDGVTIEALQEVTANPLTEILAFKI